MVIRIVRIQRPVVSRAPDWALFAEGGDESDFAEAMELAKAVLQQQRIALAEVDDESSEEEADEEQDRHVHPYPPRASNCNCN